MTLEFKKKGEKSFKTWVWRRRLFAWEEERVRECIALLHDYVLHTWKLLLDPIHGYLVRGAYRFLTTNDAPAARNVMNDLWYKNIPSKVSLFAWRLFRNRLPTRDNLARRNILHNNDSACVADCGNVETVQHLFL